MALDSLTSFDASTHQTIERVERARRVSWASLTGVVSLIDELVMARRGPKRVPMHANRRKPDRNGLETRRGDGAAIWTPSRRQASDCDVELGSGGRGSWGRKCGCDHGGHTQGVPGSLDFLLSSAQQIVARKSENSIIFEFFMLLQFV